jgi:oligogalacturonide transport system substrate-binding protein
MVLFTACATSAPPAPAGADAAEQITLRFSWWGGDARHEATLKVIEAFMAKNPNIVIEPEYGAQDGYNAKKTTEFASGTAPDIFQIETGAGPEYYALGVLYDLSSLSSISFDLFEPDFIEKNGQFGSGRQYAIPTGAAGSALIVNKTLADEIGIDFTQQYDWEQLITWGQQVQEFNPENYLISANTSAAMPFFVRAFARQINGAPIIDDATKTLNMTEEHFTQCFDFIDRMYKTGTAAPASIKEPYKENKDQEDPNWIAGKYVASVGYTSNALVLRDANPDVEYIAGRMPVMAGAKSDGWVNDTPQYIGISATTPYPEEAALFLDFFFNSEEAAEILGTVRSVPPTAMAQKIVADKDVLDELTAQAVEVSLTYNGQSDSGFSTGAEVTAILTDAYEAVAFGAITPAQAASDVVSQINDFLARQ